MKLKKFIESFIFFITADNLMSFCLLKCLKWSNNNKISRSKMWNCAFPKTEFQILHDRSTPVIQRQRISNEQTGEMGGQVVGRNTAVKTEVTTQSDGTKVTKTTTTTVTKYSDGTETTQVDVKTQTEKSGGTSSQQRQSVVNVQAPAATGQAQPAKKPSQAQGRSPPGKTDEKFVEAALKAHNDLRAKHSSPPLVVDKALCASAQQWADKIASKQKMEHSTTDLGENVYWSTKTFTTEGNVPVESWYGEIKDFNFKKMEPQKGTGHFTQVVWKDTKRMGIALAIDSKGQSYVVAHYDPAGNFIGQYAANISKPK